LINTNTRREMRTAPAGIFLCIAVAAYDVAVHKAAAFEGGDLAKALPALNFKKWGSEFYPQRLPSEKSCKY